MKRSDFWFVSLGVLQLYLFSQVIIYVAANNAVLPAVYSASEPIPVIRFAVLVVTLFIVFTNLGNLVKIITLSETELNKAITQTTMNSTIVLLCIFILYMLRGV